jgi:hypothetical protein
MPLGFLCHRAIAMGIYPGPTQEGAAKGTDIGMSGTK